MYAIAFPAARQIIASLSCLFRYVDRTQVYVRSTKLPLTDTYKFFGNKLHYKSSEYYTKYDRPRVFSI